MQRRTRLDREHPCLACYAPWAVIEETIEAAEPGVPPTWVKAGGDCSARCVETGKASIDQFQAALDERRRRGW